METTIKLFTKKREEFLKLKLHEAINWEKYNLMFISHHSTAIEGSSLTRLESQLLLDEGTTPEGKPFEHSQMEKDHFEALNFVVKEAREKQEVTPELIRAVSSKVMHGTGQVYNVAPGTFDSSKVEGLVKSLCKNLVKNIHHVETPKDIYDMAFDFHFDLVSIHPFADGNGRISRLMMNYILLYHDQVPAIIHKEDRKKYINALEESREAESNGPIKAFLYQQQIKEFERQIEKEQSGNRGQFLNFPA